MSEPTREQLLVDVEQLQRHIRRANDMAKRSGEYGIAVGGYRDEAWIERDQLHPSPASDTTPQEQT